MRKIIFIGNTDSGQGMSGGTTIYINLLKHWKNASRIFFGSARAINRLRQEGMDDVWCVETDKYDEDNIFSVRRVLYYQIRMLVKGMRTVRKNSALFKEADYIYSISDFYPDFLPAFYAKLKNRKIKWIAAYYLFAPFPFSRVCPYRGTDRFRGFLYWLSQRLSYFIVRHYADFVFVTSEPDVERFITKKREKNRIIAIQGGVDMTESEKYLASNAVSSPDKRKYDACFVGRFHWQKGVLELVDIWHMVCQKKKNARLAVLGNGPLGEKLGNKIKTAKLENNVDLLGYRNGREKYEIFKQSKMIAHPATYDSGGMAAAEGMSWGLPGVSFDLEALKTYYPKGMLKAEINNFEQFSENIIKLLDDRELYQKTSIEARDLIREEWNWENKAKKIYNAIMFEK